MLPGPGCRGSGVTEGHAVGSVTEGLLKPWRGTGLAWCGNTGLSPCVGKGIKPRAVPSTCPRARFETGIVLRELCQVSGTGRRALAVSSTWKNCYGGGRLDTEGLGGPWGRRGGWSRVVGGRELVPGTEVEEQREGARSRGVNRQKWVERSVPSRTHHLGHGQWKDWAALGGATRTGST